VAKNFEPSTEGVSAGSAPRQPREPSRRRLRKRGSGGIHAVRDGVWRVDVEVGRDSVTGRRRRVSRRIYGTREDAEIALARLKVADHEKRLPAGTNARSVGAVFKLYQQAIDAGLIELAPSTVLTVRSASKVMAAVELAGRPAVRRHPAEPADVAGHRASLRGDAGTRPQLGLRPPVRDRPRPRARPRAQARADRLQPFEGRDAASDGADEAVRADGGGGPCAARDCSPAGPRDRRRRDDHRQHRDAARCVPGAALGRTSTSTPGRSTWPRRSPTRAPGSASCASPRRSRTGGMCR
jgi:hypothetical protein